MSECSWINDRTHCDLPYEAHSKEDDRIIAEIGHNMICKGLTKKGQPCKRTDVKENGFCDAHQTQDNTTGALARSYQQVSEETKEYVRDQVNKTESAPTTEVITEEMIMEDIKEQYDFIVAATGSRSLQNKDDKHKQEVVKFLVAELQRLKEKHGRVLVVTGMAEGFDTAMAKAAQLTETDYLVAIPSPTYGEYYWGSNSITKTNRLAEFEDYVNKAAHKVVVCEDYKGFAPRRPGKANFDRNQWMVDFAQAFYVYDRSSRGTKDCVERIEKAGTPRIFLDNHMEV